MSIKKIINKNKLVKKIIGQFGHIVNFDQQSN
jgi:hypothetical protein